MWFVHGRRYYRSKRNIDEFLSPKRINHETQNRLKYDVHPHCMKICLRETHLQQTSISKLHRINRNQRFDTHQ